MDSLHVEPIVRDTSSESATEKIEPDVSEKENGQANQLQLSLSQIDLLLQLDPDNQELIARKIYFSGLLRHMEFRKSGKLQDLDAAITSYGKARRLLVDDHDQEVNLLCLIGSSFKHRFDRWMETADLVEAVSSFEAAAIVACAAGDHANKAFHLGMIANELFSCGEQLLLVFGSNFLTRNIHILDKAVTSQAVAVRITPDDHPNKAKYLSQHAYSLSIRGEQRRNVIDINDAILSREAALRLTPDNHPDQTIFLRDLGHSLMVRFSLVGDIEDIKNAISIVQRALKMTPDDDPAQSENLSTLGDCLCSCFEHLVDAEYINQAVSYHEKAVLIASETNKFRYLGALGMSLLIRFQYLGGMCDLEKAILNLESVAQLTPEDNTDKPGMLRNLGIAYSFRFHTVGDIKDIDEAILKHESAIRMIHDDHPQRPRYQGALARSFLARFQHLQRASDLDQAILNGESALRIIQGDQLKIEGTLLIDHGVSLIFRHDLRKRIGDLNRAILDLKRAAQLLKGSQHEPNALHSLAHSLSKRFRQVGDPTDLDNAIEYQALAISALPEQHVELAGFLTNHGNYLLQRFTLRGRIEDENEAIAKFEEALQILPQDHPSRTLCLLHLGESLFERYFRRENPTDLQRAITSLVDCSRSAGPPSVRFNGAAVLAFFTHPLENISVDLVMAIYSLAIQLLPQVASLGVDPDTRYHQLTRAITASHLGCDAAATAINAGKLQTALNWLERARSIVWGQTLNLRTPLDKLPQELAKRLAHVSRELERGSGGPLRLEEYLVPGFQTPFPKQSVLTLKSTSSLENAVQKQRQLADEWKMLVRQVQETKGFEDFLRPKQYSQLHTAALGGPVIVINVSQVKPSADALILLSSSDDVHHISLDNFSHQRAHDLNLKLRNILVRRGFRCGGDEEYRMKILIDRKPTNEDKRREEDNSFRHLLAELWNAIVKPVLDYLGLQMSKSANLPRIWWCPTGPLTFLPLHAAGIYSADDDSSTISLSDFAISSYTPTLTALLEASKVAEPGAFKLLAVSQAEALGLSHLSGTEKELKDHASKHGMLVLEDAEATVPEVLSGMERCSWVHLACHGVQDLGEPTKSGLLLHKGRLTLSEIIKTSLPVADFAFLSACQTASGDDSSPDEAIHLAAGMLSAGYRRVIATMWSIEDKDAPLVADTVYSHLFENGEPNSANSARALHAATQRLRERHQGRSFASWVPFIHVGV